MNILTAAKLGGPVILLAGAGVLLIYNSIYTVQGGFRAIKFSRITGLQTKYYTEGWHLRIPFFERPIIYDIKTRPYSVDAVTGSKDLQPIHLTVRVMYHPMEDKLPELYRLAGMNYAQRVLPSLTNEILRIVVAQYDAAQLLSQRDQVCVDIEAKLKERANKFFIQIKDIALTELSYSHRFNTAAELKQVRQQQAEEAKYIVDQAAQEKKSIIIRAQGEAASAELIGKAINPAYLELKRVQAAVSIAELLSRSNNRAFIDAETLLLNISGSMANKLMDLGEVPKPKVNQK